MHKEDQSLPLRRVAIIFGGAALGGALAWIAVPSDADLGIVTSAVLIAVGTTAAAFLTEPILREFILGFVEAMLDAVGVQAALGLKAARPEARGGAVAIGA